MANLKPKPNNTFAKQVIEDTLRELLVRSMEMQVMRKVFQFVEREARGPGVIDFPVVVGEGVGQL